MQEQENYPTLELEASVPEMIEGKKVPSLSDLWKGTQYASKIGRWEEIKTLKQRIQDRIGIPPYKQLLTYTGKVL